jgi:hypothetical protein
MDLPRGDRGGRGTELRYGRATEQDMGEQSSGRAAVAYSSGEVMADQHFRQYPVG